MAHITADRVLETSTTTGTGALTLAGALTGFRPFSGVAAVSDTLIYNVWAVDTNGVPTGDWEVGIGTYSATNTLTRTTVQSSSNAGAAVNFSAGTKYVSVGLSAANAVQFDAGRAVTFTNVDTIPSTASVGSVKTYSREVLEGLSAPAYVDPTGVAWDLQRDFHLAKTQKAQPEELVQALIGIRGVAETNGGNSNAPSSVSARASMVMKPYGSTTASAISGYYGNHTRVFRGTAPNTGGFYYTMWFALGDVSGDGTGGTNQERSFVGLTDITSALVGTDWLAATSPGRVGVAHGTKPSNWNVVHNVTGTAPTVIPLGSNFPATNANLYLLSLFAAPNDSGISWRVDAFTDTALVPAFTVRGRITTNLPAAGTVLTHRIQTENTTSTGSGTIRAGALTITSPR